MDAVHRSAPVSRLERSSHTALIDNNTLFVWGGYQVSGCVCTLPSTCAGVFATGCADKENKLYEPVVSEFILKSHLHLV